MRVVLIGCCFVRVVLIGCCFVIVVLIGCCFVTTVAWCRALCIAEKVSLLLISIS